MPLDNTSCLSNTIALLHPPQRVGCRHPGHNGTERHYDELKDVQAVHQPDTATTRIVGRTSYAPVSIGNDSSRTHSDIEPS